MKGNIAELIGATNQWIFATFCQMIFRETYCLAA